MIVRNTDHQVFVLLAHLLGTNWKALHSQEWQSGYALFFEMKECSLHVQTEVHTVQKPSDDETCFAC